MELHELAYIAGIIDTHAIIRLREYNETVLPMVAVHGPNASMLAYLARRTGTKVTWIERNYHRGGCVEHCPEPHVHIVSKSGRWHVSGAKATIMLSALRPFLQLQGYGADQAIEVGMKAPKKQATPEKMRVLGWPVPEEWT